jgi:WS/DGAT C-terminal domain
VPRQAIAGNIAQGVAVMSYAGQLNLTAVADRDGCPDVEVFAEGLRRVLGELAREPAPPAQALDQVALPASRCGLRPARTRMTAPAARFLDWALPADGSSTATWAGNPVPLGRPAGNYARWHITGSTAGDCAE